MWNMAVFSLVLLSFVLGACEFIMLGIVPDIAESLSVPLTKAGMLISWFALAYAVGTPILSLWGSRFQRYQFLLVLTALFVLGNGATFFVEDYEWLLADRLVLASLAGVILSVSTTFAPDIADRRYLPSVMAWIFAGFSIASVFGVPVGTLAAAYVSWKYIFVAIALVGVVNWLLMARYLPRGSGAPVVVRMKEELGLLKDPRILLGVAAGVCTLAGNYTWYAYVTPILQQVLGMEALWVSPFLFLFGVMTVISNLGSGRVAAAGGMYILWYILAAEAAVVALLLVTFHSFWLGLLNMLVIGVLIYIHNSSIQIYFLHISSLFHPGTLLMAGALLPTAANTGIALGTAVGSAATDWAGLAWTPLPGVFFLAAAALAAWVLMRPERKRLEALSYHRK